MYVWSDCINVDAHGAKNIWLYILWCSLAQWHCTFFIKKFCQVHRKIRLTEFSPTRFIWMVAWAYLPFFVMTDRYMHSPMINNKEFHIFGLFCGLLLHHEYGTLIFFLTWHDLPFPSNYLPFGFLVFFISLVPFYTFQRAGASFWFRREVSVGRSNRDKKTTINKCRCECLWPMRWQKHRVGRVSAVGLTSSDNVVREMGRERC